MLRFIMPFLIIGAAIAGFFMFTSPIYDDIKALKAESASYDEALNNAKALDAERDKLTSKYNTISAENLNKLAKFLPENVDNIRLILEIEKLAAPFGMVLKDVEYDTAPAADATATTSTTPGLVSGRTAPSARKDYGTLELQFSTSGTYPNFLNFLRALENNLRAVDIASISFSSETSGNKNEVEGSTVPIYEYDFKIKTYWLKN
ncbi:MAG: hypothetical protein WD991_02605 [Candidatus Paceibacterota bacterium]